MDINGHDVVIGSPYKEPTQWCVNITIDGLSHQLCLQDYPPSGSAPPEETVIEIVTKMTLPEETAVILIAEDGTEV